MKTPKEILLQRHQAVEPKLNAIRRQTVATLARPGIAQTWREFIVSMRWHLAGMGAVWMAVLLLNLDSAPRSAVVIAQDKIPSARVLLAALLENRRELLELTGTPPTGEPRVLPPRRSENQSAIEIV
jgi:hypothetical protein